MACLEMQKLPDVLNLKRYKGKAICTRVSTTKNLVVLAHYKTMCLTLGAKQRSQCMGHLLRHSKPHILLLT